MSRWGSLQSTQSAASSCSGLHHHLHVGHPAGSRCPCPCVCCSVLFSCICICICICICVIFCIVVCTWSSTRSTGSCGGIWGWGSVLLIVYYV